MSQKIVLTAIWWVWGLFIIIFLVFTSMQSKLFGGDLAKAWQWFLPNIIPTLTMVGASAHATPQTTSASSSDITPFIIAVAASVIYLFLLSLSVIAILFVSQPLQSLQQSSLWLAPMQGLAASSLAVYFIKK